MAAAKKTKDIKQGSKNIFTDLGLEPDNLVKAELTRQLDKRIRELGLTQVEASHRLGISQPDVCKLMQGKFTGFKIDRLLMLLNALAIDIRIELKAKARTAKAGTLQVSA